MSLLYEGVNMGKKFKIEKVITSDGSVIYLGNDDYVLVSITNGKEHLEAVNLEVEEQTLSLMGVKIAIILESIANGLESLCKKDKDNIN